jgi:beta-xylosidase
VAGSQIGSVSLDDRVGTARFRELERIVEPGDLEVLVGTSAAHLPCRGTVRLTGPLRIVGHNRRLVTPVTVTRNAASASG